MDQPMYPHLIGQLAERGIKRSAVANALHCSTRALQNKIAGKTEFTWSEICTLQRQFFPDLSKEDLLARHVSTPPHNPTT